MEASFGDLWQREQFSDVDILITACAPRPPRAARAEPEVLASFPGHNVFLSRSLYLEALVRGFGAATAATADQRFTLVCVLFWAELAGSGASTVTVGMCST
jgi:hypothetical protein